MAMPLDEYRGSGKSEFNTTPKALFNEAIEALLAEDTIHQRVSQARGCLEKLERVNGDADAELTEELRCIIDDGEAKLKGSQELLSREDEDELSERLFSLWLNIADGLLIWL